MQDLDAAREETGHIGGTALDDRADKSGCSKPQDTYTRTWVDRWRKDRSVKKNKQKKKKKSAE